MKTVFTGLILGLSLTASAQSNYYVSPTGNNTNNGSLSKPWKTLQFSLSTMAAGDTLNLLSGTYSELFSVPKNNQYIRNAENATAIIDATGLSSADAVISINNRTGVTIDGLEIRNNIQVDAQGIVIQGKGNKITIKNCNIHDIHFSANPLAPVNSTTNAQGIVVYGTDGTTPYSNIKILNNQLHDCRLGYSEGIALNGNVSGFEISGNTISNLTNIGIDIVGHEKTSPTAATDQARNGTVSNNLVHHCQSKAATSAGIYVDGGKSTIIENNTSYHNGYGIEVGCENVTKSTDSITVRNNILYDNEIAAVAFGGYDFPNGSGKVMNSSFTNNTCYFNDFTKSGNGEMYLSYSENAVIENNIFYINDEKIFLYADISQSNLKFDYNLVYCSAGQSEIEANWNGTAYAGFYPFISGSGTNIHSGFADPMFVMANITTPDFHLSVGSPAINMGDPAFVPAVTEKDIDGEERLGGGAIDCGADEFYKCVCPGMVENQLNSVHIFPNPATDKLSVIVNKETGYQILDATGRIKLIGTLSPADNSIEVNDLSEGIYLLQIDGASARFVVNK